MTKSRSDSSRRWLNRQHKDEYVAKALKDGYRSRAAYKLLELDAELGLFFPQMTIIDLGAAPGSWSQVASHKAKNSKVVALDLLAIEPLQGVDIIEGDFRDEKVVQSLQDVLAGAKVDLLLSDMAPNFSGVSGSDVLRAVYLGELALEFANSVLKPGARLLIKQFQGPGYQEFLDLMRGSFTKVMVKKPKASRRESREVYVIGLGFKREVSLE